MEERLPSDIQKQITGVVDELAREFERKVPREAVARRASTKLEEFHDARILDFLPILVWRSVREELKRSLAA